VSKHFTTKSVEVPKCRNAKLRNAVSTKAVVTAVGHIVEELSSCFGVSGTATWKVEKPNNRIAEMPKCETSLGSARGHSRWSHRRKMGEGVSEDKLLFGVSGVGKWRVLKSSTTLIPKCEERNAEMNARFREVNPMVQMKLKKIGGLL
jgi:hypothetical protein